MSESGPMKSTPIDTMGEAPPAKAGPMVVCGDWRSVQVDAVDAKQNVFRVIGENSFRATIVGTRTFVVGQALRIRKIDLPDGSPSWEVVGVP
jgi:hypothetical protein